MDKKVQLVSEETMRLAKKAAEQKGWWLKIATPEEKEEWLNQIAEAFANAGEAEYGEGCGTFILDSIAAMETED